MNIIMLREAFSVWTLRGGKVESALITDYHSTSVPFVKFYS